MTSHDQSISTEESRSSHPVDSKGARRILLFQTAFLGDLVLTLPLIDAIKTLWPDSTLAVVAIPSTKTLVENHPLVDEVIVYDKRGGERSFPGMARLIRTLRCQRFTVAYTPHRSFRTALILALAGIPKRIGFAGTPGSWLYSQRIHRDPARHETARNLALLGKEGESASTSPRIAVSKPSQLKVEVWLARAGLEGKSFVAMAPGSVWATKRWPWIYWTRLAKAMTTRQNRAVVLVGGPDDDTMCEEIAQQAGEGVFNAAGRFDIPGSAELLRHADLLITGDTAPLHLGVGVETPVLAIFGPTVPEFGFAPTGKNDRVIGLELDCRPCAIHGGEVCPLGHHHCMRKLEPEAVESAAREMLAQVESSGEGKR